MTLVQEKVFESGSDKFVGLSKNIDEKLTPKVKKKLYFLIIKFFMSIVKRKIGEYYFYIFHTVYFI